MWIYIVNDKHHLKGVLCLALLAYNNNMFLCVCIHIFSYIGG